MIGNQHFMSKFNDAYCPPQTQKWANFFLRGMIMSGRYVKIQSDDGKYWSGDFSATITGTKTSTMKLLSSSSERFEIITDDTGWYKYIAIEPTSVYLQYTTASGHTALTQSDIPAPSNADCSPGISSAPPAPSPLTFRLWQNDQLKNQGKVIIMTSEGLYLTRAQSGSVSYIDSADTVGPACIFTIA